MDKELKILQIITHLRNSHSQMVNIFSFGSCMNFYLIMKSIFPEAEAWYNFDHIIVKIDSDFYDITGKVPSKGYSPFEASYCDRKAELKAFNEMVNGEFILLPVA